jgi:transcriptional regulator with XRE-family HTH domain
MRIKESIMDEVNREIYGIDVEQNITTIIGKNIRRLRLREGCTQEYLASRLVVPVIHIEQYEQGYRTISAAHLHVLQVLLSCTLDDLYPPL